MLLPAALAALALLAAAGSTAAAPSKGGTYRVGWENAFGFTDNLDPTGEYYNLSFAILSSLMVRMLVGYNHVAGPAGNKVVPDLATAVPAPTDGGKTYTFHLKHVKFGPPVNRAVTSNDVLYALERLASPKDGGEYGFYFTPISGWDAYAAGKAKTISGIGTPDPATVVFHLTRPTGDFLYRLALPAAGPIPREVAGCFAGQAGRYGRDVVSTGPYMIEGADKVDASSCARVKPMSGFDGQTFLTLVRNPSYDPSTDSKAAREKLPMKLTQPPFDDIHVRRAMNWVLDKAAMLQAWGGPLVGKVATHIVPNNLFDNQLAEYDPYQTPGGHGSLAKAKAAMKGSKYDTKGDGTCSAAACKNVYLLADTNEVDTKLVPIVEAGAKKLEISFKLHQVKGAHPTLETPAHNIPIAEFPGWGKDYADPLTFFAALFDGRSIIPTGNTNYSLVGITPAIAKKANVKGNLAGIPNLDARLDRCSALLGQPRLSCYEALDRYLMTQVVPLGAVLLAIAAAPGRQARHQVELRPVQRRRRLRPRRRLVAFTKSSRLPSGPARNLVAWRRRRRSSMRAASAGPSRDAGSAAARAAARSGRSSKNTLRVLGWDLPRTRSECCDSSTSRPTRPSASRQGSTSSTACSAAASCRPRSSWSAGSRASASRRCS
jgi:peptide/nickel transport system substrate-binding protein